MSTSFICSKNNSPATNSDANMLKNQRNEKRSFIDILVIDNNTKIIVWYNHILQSMTISINRFPSLIMSLYQQFAGKKYNNMHISPTVLLMKQLLSRVRSWIRVY